MKRTILSFAILGLLATSSPAQEVDYNSFDTPRFEPVRKPVYFGFDPIFYMEDFADFSTSAIPNGGTNYFVKTNATWDGQSWLNVAGGSPTWDLRDSARVQGGVNITPYSNAASAQPRFVGNYLQFFRYSQQWGSSLADTVGGVDASTVAAPADNPEWRFATFPTDASPGAVAGSEVPVGGSVNAVDDSTHRVGATLTIDGAPSGLLSFSGRLLAGGALDAQSHGDTLQTNFGQLARDAGLEADAFQITVTREDNSSVYFYHAFDENAAQEGSSGWITRVFDDGNTYVDADSGSGNIAEHNAVYEFDAVFNNNDGGDLTIDFQVLGGFRGITNLGPEELHEFFGLDDLVLQSVLTPEPSSMILFGVAVAGLGAVVLRQRRKK